MSDAMRNVMVQYLRILAGVVIFVIAVSSAAIAQSDRSLMRDGNRAYTDKKFSDAEINYRKALEKNQNLTNGVFNLGDALYKQERYPEAADQYRKSAEKATSAGEKSEALHNLGNALLKDKKYEESIAAFKESMKLNSKDDDTRYNYEYAKAMLQKQQQQQKQNQQNKDQNKKDDKKQDQKKQDQQNKDQQKKDQEKKDQDKQGQQNKEEQQKQDQQKPGQPKKQQISKQDAERILEALKNQEQKVQAKLHKQKAVGRGSVEKDW